MSTIRQSELFASQDWQVLYRAFTQINFNATDPVSINQSLREYIRTNYPEDFNDWIESSEFVAIIDLLSWLAGTLAFKIDINARENFLETAQARESILRLARFLSYTPNRARAATGLVKLIEVSTDDDVTDATGRSLTGQAIRWNNVDDRDWFEKFTTVLNAAFINTNPFGTPLKTGLVGEVATQLYRVNGRMGDNDFRFNSRVNGNSADFQICNLDFDDGEIFTERTPDLESAFHMAYRTDGNGNSSPNTGFFMLFKQGLVKTQTFTITNPVENQLLNIDSSNIAEGDVWVQSVNSNGQVLKNWKRTPTLYSDNTTYNSLPTSERDIFGVITRDNDAVTIRFSDGYFGNAPVGNIAVTYRTVNGERYIINPLDISRVKLAFSYINRRGVRRTLNMLFSLYSPVSNATTRETDAQIRRRAPSVYSTQGRMVSGEDYNLFPLSSNLAVKLKAVNRIYAGHSRYIDLNDPTSTYQDTNVFGDDGIVFEEPSNYYEEVPLSLNRSPAELVSFNIQPMLQQKVVRQHVLSAQIVRALETTNPLYVQPPVGQWVQSTAAQYSSTGYFSADYAHVKVGATLLFQLPDNSRKWVTIMAVTGPISTPPANDLAKGPVTLAEAIPTGSSVLATVPTYAPALNEDTFDAIKEKVNLGQSFALWFDPLSTEWVITDYTAINVDANTPANHPAALKIATVEQVSNTLWKLMARGQTIVFESERKVQWYADGEKVVDGATGASKIDTISVLSINPDLNSTSGLSIREASVFNTAKMYYALDGKHEPRRIHLSFTDDDEDGGYDQPNAFHRLLSLSRPKSTLFWKKVGVDFIPTSEVYVYTDSVTLNAAPKTNGLLAYCLPDDKFYLGSGTAWIEQVRRNFRVARGRGRNVAAQWTTHAETTTPIGTGLAFQWKHYANTEHRIDPSRTNIIDMFVLSNEYDFLTRQWIANGSVLADLPEPPSELDLRLTFRSYEAFKMFTDEIVWRPVRYKLLFGNGAENLRAKFKVVKLSNTTSSDGEIKSRIIRAINDFFDISRWDFGETFYFTELAAFVHQQLASSVASFVIVPLNETASFGDGFEVSAQSDEIFISTAQVSDIEIISSNTSGDLRIR